MEPKDSTFSFLDRLRRFSRISADTSDYQAAKDFRPDDLTTNPSLLLQFLDLKPEISDQFIKRAIAETQAGFTDIKSRVKEWAKNYMTFRGSVNLDDARVFIVPVADDSCIGKSVNTHEEGVGGFPCAVYSQIDGCDCYILSMEKASSFRYVLLIVKGEEADKKLEKKLEEEENTDFLQQCADHFAAMVAIDILKNIKGNVSVEVPPRLSENEEGTVDYAEDLMRLLEKYGKESDVDHRRVYIKIPATYAGIAAAKTLENDKNIRCNLTLIFSFVQALYCMAAKVSVISPFVGRLTQWHKEHNDGVGAGEMMEKMLQKLHDCTQYFLDENGKRALDDHFDEKKIALSNEQVKEEVVHWKNRETVIDFLCESKFSAIDGLLKRLKHWQKRAKKNIFSLDTASVESLVALQRVECEKFLYTSTKSFSQQGKMPVDTDCFTNLQRQISAVSWLCQDTLESLKPLFYRHLDPGILLVRRCCAAIKKGQYVATQVLAASFRSLEQIVALAGVPIITISLDFLAQLKNKPADENFWSNVQHFDRLLPEELLLKKIREIMSNEFHRHDEMQQMKRLFDSEMLKDNAACALLSDGIRRFDEDYQTFIDKIRTKKDILSKDI